MPYQSLTTETQTISPYPALDDFFSIAYRKPEATKLLYKMTRSAFANKSRLSKKDILDLLYFKTQMTSLLEAASQLNADSTKLINHSVQTPANTPDWERLPHHLNPEECINPLLVLEKCFRKKTAQKWAELLEDIFHAAAYDGFFTTAPADKDIYHSCHSLFKLLEACHLIYLRERLPH